MAIKRIIIQQCDTHIPNCVTIHGTEAQQYAIIINDSYKSCRQKVDR